MKEILITLTFISFIILSYSLKAQEPAIRVKQNREVDYTKPNLFIDVDLNSLMKNPNLSEAEKKTNTQMIYSAYKRAYKYLSVRDDGFYQLNIKNGAEIGISERLFKMIKYGIDDTNKSLLEMRKTYPDARACEISRIISPKYWSWDKVCKAYKMYGKTQNSSKQ